MSLEAYVFNKQDERIAALEKALGEIFEALDYAYSDERPDIEWSLGSTAHREYVYKRCRVVQRRLRDLLSSKGGGV